MTAHPTMDRFLDKDGSHMQPAQRPPDCSDGNAEAGDLEVIAASARAPPQPSDNNTECISQAVSSFLATTIAA